MGLALKNEISIYLIDKIGYEDKFYFLLSYIQFSGFITITC